MQEEMSSPVNVSPPRSAAAIGAPITPVKPAVSATAQDTPVGTTEDAHRGVPVTPSNYADAPATPVKQATPVAVASSEALSPADQKDGGAAAPETPGKLAVPAQISVHETVASEAAGGTPKRVSVNDKVEEVSALNSA